MELLDKEKKNRDKKITWNSRIRRNNDTNKKIFNLRNYYEWN